MGIHWATVETNVGTGWIVAGCTISSSSLGNGVEVEYGGLTVWLSQESTDGDETVPTGTPIPWTVAVDLRRRLTMAQAPIDASTTAQPANRMMPPRRRKRRLRTGMNAWLGPAAHPIDQNAVHKDGIRGRCGFPKVQVQFLPNYLRRDATALGLRLLSMLDITSSFHKDSDEM